ncbi:SWIM zinc finger family protein [Paenibacillus sp. y28]|uniref:SWIM zinc finger family protein n=1 Tax=Paenibacillus sp. y28 TaxID=3129110 RepID=UPI0030193062
MLRTQISKEQMEALAADIRTYFDAEVMRRGLEYQQKGLVYNAQIQDETKYSAKVQGSRVFDAELDLTFLVSSSCTCEEEGYCEHMAGAFLYAYAAVCGRPDEFVRSMAAPGPDALKSRTASVRIDSSLHRLTTMLTGLEPKPGAVPRETDSAERWSGFFEEMYGRFAHSHAQQRNHLDDYFAAALQMLTQPISWWNTGLRRLYIASSIVYLMQRLDDMARMPRSSPYDSPGLYAKAAKLLHEKLNQAVKDATGNGKDDHRDSASSLHSEHSDGDTSGNGHSAATPVKNPSASSEQSAALALNLALHEQLFRKPAGIVDWLHVYRLLWLKLLRLDRRDEEARLSKLRGEPGLNGRQRDLTRLAEAHFAVLGGRDEEAAARLSLLGESHAEDMLPYLNSFYQTKAWSRLLFWLRWLLPLMKKAEPAVFQLVADYWNEALKHEGSPEEWQSALVAMLPRSYAKLSAFLLQHGRYKEWMSLHLYNAASPYDLSTLELKQLEGADPRMLLPLYHQAIDRLVVQRNREAYRMAVKMLKKLQTLYTAAGETGRFHEFIARFSLQYGRLRAFQEELKKGKLLT